MRSFRDCSRRHCVSYNVVQVTIARAVANNPDVLLLDEPTFVCLCTTWFCAG